MSIVGPSVFEVWSFWKIFQPAICSSPVTPSKGWRERAGYLALPVAQRRAWLGCWASSLFFSRPCWHSALWGRPRAYIPNKRMLYVLEIPWIFIDRDHACLQHVLTSAWGTAKPPWLALLLSVLQILDQNYKSCRWKGHLDWIYQEKFSLLGRAKSCSTQTLRVLYFIFSKFSVAMQCLLFLV